MVRVDIESAAGAPDGRSWETAYESLPDALAVAVRRNVSEPCAVWVADGVYRVFDPETGAGLRPFGVDIYGGFAGTELSTGARDVAAHPTILDGLDGTTGARAEHIMEGSSNTLDGLTFTRALVAIADSGLLPVPTLIRTCTFIDNGTAVNRERTEVADCLFVENEVGVNGPWGGNARTISGSTFVRNGTAVQGYRYVRHSTFIANRDAAQVLSAPHSLFFGNGRALITTSSHDFGPPACRHCTFFANGGLGVPPIASHSDMPTWISHSIAWDNDPITMPDDGVSRSIVEDPARVGHNDNIGLDPQFVHVPRGWGRTLAGSTDSAVLLHDASAFAVGDVIEIQDDGIARVVTTVEGATVRFEPAYTGIAAEMFVATWGPGETNLQESFTPSAGSPAIDAWSAHDPGPYFDGDGDGFEECDLGAYELVP